MELVWGLEEDKRYEHAVDRGVLYRYVNTDVYDFGVVWNGIVNVEESAVGGSVDSFYFDGIKHMDLVNYTNYQAQVSCYTIPTELLAAIGDKPLIPGFTLTRQARSLVGLSYRTFVGPDLGYKIHMVYNILPTPTVRGYSTIGDTTSAEIFSWQLDCFPPVGSGYRPTAHFIVDSEKIPAGALEALEAILYGTLTTTARLPSADELRDLVVLWNPIIILPQRDTGLAGLVSGDGDLYTTSMDGIFRALPQTRLLKTPIDGLYRLE